MEMFLHLLAYVALLFSTECRLVIGLEQGVEQFDFRLSNYQDELSLRERTKRQASGSGVVVPQQPGAPTPRAECVENCLLRLQDNANITISTAVNYLLNMNFRAKDPAQSKESFGNVIGRLCSHYKFSYVPCYSRCKQSLGKYIIGMGVMPVMDFVCLYHKAEFWRHSSCFEQADEPLRQSRDKCFMDCELRHGDHDHHNHTDLLHLCSPCVTECAEQVLTPRCGSNSGPGQFVRRVTQNYAQQMVEMTLYLGAEIPKTCYRFIT